MNKRLLACCVLAGLAAFGLSLSLTVGHPLRRQAARPARSHEAIKPTSGHTTAAKPTGAVRRTPIPGRLSCTGRIMLHSVGALRGQAVRVEDDHGGVLERIVSDDEGRVRFDVPAQARRISLRALFLRSQPAVALEIPRPLPSQPIDLGTVVFGTGLSGIVLEILCGNRFAEGLSCGLRLPRPRRSVSHHPRWIRSAAARQQVVFELPGNEQYFAYLSLSQFSERTAAQVSRRGGWIVHTFSLCDVEVVEPEVVGVPEATGRNINLYRVGSNSVLPERNLSIDARRRIHVLARFRQPRYRERALVASILTDDGVHVRLLADGQGDGLQAWTRTLVPARPLVGVALLDASRRVDRTTPWAITLRTAGQPISRKVLSRRPGVRLLCLQTLRDADQLTIRTVRGPIGPLSPADLVPVGSGLLGVPPALAKESATLRVTCRQPAQDWTLVVQAQEGDRRRAEATENGAVFDIAGLAPGRYSLSWSWGEGKGGVMKPPFASGVVLRAGATTRLSAEPPTKQIRHGRFVGWDRLPGWLIPTGVIIRGPLATIGPDGRFEARCATPLPKVGDLWVRGRIGVLRDVVEVRPVANESLEIRLRPGRVLPISLDIEGAASNENLLVDMWIVAANETGDLEPPFGSMLMQRRLGHGRSMVVASTPGETAIGFVRRVQPNGAPGDLVTFFEAAAGEHEVTVQGRKIVLVAPSRSPEGVTQIVASWISPSGRHVRLPLGRIASGGTLDLWRPDTLQEILVVRGGIRHRLKLGTERRVVLP